jgi:quercetin dioxygenase-like cupin family protein
MRPCLAFPALALCFTSVFAQQRDKSSGEITQPHHLVVPLTSKGLSGIVSGDPTKAGAQYVIRMYNDAGFIVLPHWHPEDEKITVVKGKWYFGSGETYDSHNMRELNVGDYALVPKQMAHFAWSKTDTIILIHGIGPFEQTNTDAQQSLSGWTLDPQKGLFRDPQSASYFKFKLNDRVRSEHGDGVIAYGQHSERNKVTQYTVQKEDGSRFFETEDHLGALPQHQSSDFGALTGMWEGVIHGVPQGDLPFTVIFQQDHENVSGVFAFFFGGAAFHSATLRNNELDLHMDTPLANFQFNAKYEADAISGQWSTDEGSKGTWEGKRSSEKR